MPLNPDFINVAELTRQAALKLLEECDALSAPVDLVDLCQKNDWPLSFEALENDKSAATTLMDGDYIRIVVNTKYSDNADGFSSDSSLRRRQRFSLAHEIGHACLNTHNKYELQKLLTEADNPHRGRYKLLRESQANDFASELLLPEPLLKDQMKQFRWDDVINAASGIADAFDVSLTVALRRITTMADFAAVMFYFDSNGTAPQRAITSKYFSDTGLPLPTGASMPGGSLVGRLAGDPSSRVSTMRNMNASIWFGQGPKAQGFKIQEWAHRLGSYGYLSFLAVTEDEDWSGSRNRRGGYDDDDDWMS